MSLSVSMLPETRRSYRDEVLIGGVPFRLSEDARASSGTGVLISAGASYSPTITDDLRGVLAASNPSPPLITLRKPRRHPCERRGKDARRADSGDGGWELAGAPSGGAAELRGRPFEGTGVAARNLMPQLDGAARVPTQVISLSPHPTPP